MVVLYETIRMTEEEFDIVIHTLQEKRDILWKMTEKNMSMNLMNIMDDIRLAQIEQLNAAIAMWKNRWMTESLLLPVTTNSIKNG